jgi:hypothetical protein
MFSLFCVLAQPAARPSSTIALKILDKVGICFMAFDVGGFLWELVRSQLVDVHSGEMKRRSASAAWMAGRMP